MPVKLARLPLAIFIVFRVLVARALLFRHWCLLEGHLTKPGRSSSAERPETHLRGELLDQRQVDFRSPLVFRHILPHFPFRCPKSALMTVDVLPSITGHPGSIEKAATPPATRPAHCGTNPGIRTRRCTSAFDAVRHLVPGNACREMWYSGQRRLASLAGGPTTGRNGGPYRSGQFIAQSSWCGRI